MADFTFSKAGLSATIGSIIRNALADDQAFFIWRVGSDKPVRFSSADVLSVDVSDDVLTVVGEKTVLAMPIVQLSYVAADLPSAESVS